MIEIESEQSRVEKYIQTRANITNECKLSEKIVENSYNNNR